MPQTPSSSILNQRLADFEQVLITVETEFADDHYAAGFGTFREAVSLSRGLAPLEERVITFAAEQAGRWLPEKWRLSKSLLQEVGEANSHLSELDELQEGIQQHEREQSIHVALKAADEESSNGLATLARQRLLALALQYPGDARIEDRLNAIQGLCASEVEGERVRQAQTEAEKAEETRLLARATWARAREFEKAAFYSEALEQWLALRRIDPQHPGIENEIERCRTLQDGAAENSAAQISGPAVPLAQATSGRLTTAATLTFVGLALTASVFLITMHFAKRNPALSPVIEPSVAPRPVPPGGVPEAQVDNKLESKLDNNVWAAVDRNDADAVVAYLKRFPAGVNRPLAVQALVDFRHAERATQEAAEVLTAVKQYAAAWTARDPDAIVAIQSYLDRRTVETQLAPVRSLVMSITPASAPRISGEQATLRCRRRVSEVLDNGVAKQIPEETVTFVLAKREGVWTVADMRP